MQQVAIGFTAIVHCHCCCHWSCGLYWWSLSSRMLVLLFGSCLMLSHRCCKDSGAPRRVVPAALEVAVALKFHSVRDIAHDCVCSRVLFWWFVQVSHYCSGRCHPKCVVVRAAIALFFSIVATLVPHGFVGRMLVVLVIVLLVVSTRCRGFVFLWVVLWLKARRS
jgi:hypothetical protein